MLTYICVRKLRFFSLLHDDKLAKKLYKSGDATHRRLKRGPNPSQVVQAEDARRPVARKFGVKKRLAAAVKRPAAALKRPAASS